MAIEPVDFELELLPSGLTTVKQIPVEHEILGDADLEPLGLHEAFGLGRAGGHKVTVYRPSENNKTGGKWLIMVDSFTAWECLWAAHIGVVLAFLREQAAVITADALVDLTGLYQDQRDDADARAKGYRNRHDEERRVLRKIHEKKSGAA